MSRNAGAYGKEIKDVLQSAEAVDRGGKRHILDASSMGFRYRGCAIPEDWIFLAAEFHAEPGDAEEISARMAEIGGARNESQPIRSRTGGSQQTLQLPHQHGQRISPGHRDAGRRGAAAGA
jgi:UDP-N-acetylmuramate dehydrogenase